MVKTSLMFTEKHKSRRGSRPYRTYFELIRLQAAIRLEAIAIRLEAIASRPPSLFRQRDLDGRGLEQLKHFAWLKTGQVVSQPFL